MATPPTAIVNGIELGLKLLIEQRLAALATPIIVPGGFMVQLQPQDLITPTVRQAWAYRSIVATPDYHLGGETGWTEWDVQLDCHGYSAQDAINLARAIETVLRPGFKGNLPDPAATYVFGLFRLPPWVDGYSDANRSYVRSLEYTVQYNQL